MRFLNAVIIFAASTGFLRAQKLELRDKYSFKDRLSGGVFYCAMNNVSANFNQNPLRSIGWDFMFYEEWYLKDKILFSTGLGGMFENFDINGQLTKDHTGKVHFLVNDSKFKVNKYALHYLQVPLELRYRNDASGFKLYGGINNLLLVNSHHKTVRNGEKNKQYGQKQFSRYRSNVYVKVGVNQVLLSASYSVSPIFNSKENVYPGVFQIGLSFYY